MISPTRLPPLILRDRPLGWGDRTYLMGVLNVTPDSFSDGGEFNTLEAARDRARYLAQVGADLLDVGGQSTRPGATIISLEEELARTIPVIQALRAELDTPISIDTTRATVAAAAVAAGADLVNDVSGGQDDPEMFPTVARLGVPYVLMHRRGTPQTMQQQTEYQDLVGEILEFLQRQRAQAVAAGILAQNLIFDPGLGFAKTADQSFDLIRATPRFRALGQPILLGPSRKSFLGYLLNRPEPKERLWGTAAACCGAIAYGADLLRVHDVAAMADVCRVADRLFRQP